MKTIGLLGGMSWESTATYYKLINKGVKAELGALNSAKILLHSFNFEEIAELQKRGDWQAATTELVTAAKHLETAGADCILICTNTMHLVAPEIEATLSVPLLHIGDATGKSAKAQGFKKVALLGTAFTMEQAFYKDRLHSQFGIEVLIPDENDRADVHRIIYDELCQGIVSDDSRRTYQAIIKKLASDGAEAVILGCTEIPLLISKEDCDLPLLDTTRLHAEAAVEFALK